MKARIIFFMMLMFSMTSFAQSLPDTLEFAHSGGGGNGGDYIRMKFIQVGNFILQNYKGNLQKIESKVNVEKLRKTLDINVISTTDELLYDNRGNPVDALGSINRITLYRGTDSANSGWYGLFKRDELVEKLVLHEMLRAAGVNDDNYIYSSQVLDKYDSESFNKEYYIKWCSESGAFIQSALKQGVMANKYSKEIVIYEQVLGQVESKISPKHYYFLAPGINGALKISKLFLTEKSRVNYLKLALSQLARDLKYVDQQLKRFDYASTQAIGNHAAHTSRYINNALKFSLLSETAAIETEVLNVILEQVYGYMIQSDFARTKYLPIFAEIDTARYSSSNTYKLSALRYILEILSK